MSAGCVEVEAMALIPTLTSGHVTCEGSGPRTPQFSAEGP